MQTVPNGKTPITDGNKHRPKPREIAPCCERWHRIQCRSKEWFLLKCSRQIRMNREFLPFERWLKWIQNCFSERYAAYGRTAQTSLLIFKGRCVESRAEGGGGKRARMKWGRKTGLGGGQQKGKQMEENAWSRLQQERERARKKKKKSNTSSHCYSFSFEPLNPEWLPMGRNGLSALRVR